MRIKRVNYKNYSDQYLIDSFKNSGNELALAALYARYRVSLGNYLHRRIDDSGSVTKIYNSIVTQLLMDTNTWRDKFSFAISIFALAHQHGVQYLVKQPSAQALKAPGARDYRTSYGLSESQLDLIELVYRLYFTPVEATKIIDVSESEIPHCLSFIAKYSQNSLDSFKRSQPLCQITRVAHPPAAKQQSSMYTAS